MLRSRGLSIIALAGQREWRRLDMNLTSEEKQGLADLSKSLYQRFHAAEVILYGSAARDEMDEYSDIDIFVVLPEVNWEIEKEIISLCFQAELKYGRVFSVACYSTSELKDGPLGESPLVMNVRKYGLAL